MRSTCIRRSSRGIEAREALPCRSTDSAGSVNIAMLLLAAASLRGQEGTDTIEGAHAVVTANLGEVVGLFFGIGLLASGLASSAVGSYAGASIMQGLLRLDVPIVWQRAVT